MGLVKRIVRSRAVQEVLGLLVAGYLKLVQRTNRFVMEPANAYDRIDMPVIAAMWHGQHFMIHFAKRPQDRAASLVSRSGDGEFNAIALRHLGVRPSRGSRARGRAGCCSPSCPRRPGATEACCIAFCSSSGSASAYW